MKLYPLFGGQLLGNRVLFTLQLQRGHQTSCQRVHTDAKLLGFGSIVGLRVLTPVLAVHCISVPGAVVHHAGKVGPRKSFGASRPRWWIIYTGYQVTQENPASSASPHPCANKRSICLSQRLIRYRVSGTWACHAVQTKKYFQPSCNC